MHTRIAPTPSGYLHIGNACSFLLTRQLANRYTGTLRLRIDDIDNSRTRPAYLADIFEVLQLLEMEYDNGPVDIADFQENHTQHQRLPLYQMLLKELCNTGLVYACTCSRKNRTGQGDKCLCKPKNIPLEAVGTAWRLQVPAETTICFTDEKIGKQSIFLAMEMPDFVIRKKDGLPAYQVASLADDLHYGIDYIVRGYDLLPSTAAQLYMAQVTGKETFLSNRFYHHPLLNSAEGLKLSKSAGAASVKKNLATAGELATLHKIVTHWLS